ncbi:hypothetical protein [Curtobacterium pusillum]|uniref:hypothetical protein n=1 Tax=Curtobacterium pusillum TaxID=69373 RepID=UPI0011A4FDFD|nr:hypothetical protein [Curtobacterium pusillum]
MSDWALDKVATLIRSLELTDECLTGSDEVVDRLQRIKLTLGELPSSEPWLKSWLDREHVKAALLFTAAKTSYRKRYGTPNFAAQAARDNAISRFNEWRDETLTHVGEYRRSDRTADTVQTWYARAQAFLNDPSKPGT